MNDQNLKKYSEYSAKEKEEFHRQGGIASGQSKRRRKPFAETLQAALAREITVEQDTEAFRAVRDTIGENPRQAVDVGLTSGPVSGMDLSQLSDDQLRAMIAAREEAAEND